MDKKQKIISILEDMTVAEQVEIHNRYCEECNYPDDQIYTMDEFEEIIGNPSYMTLAQMIYYGNFNPNEKYWWFDSYGNLKSSDDPCGDNQIYMSDIANAMLRDDSGYGNDDIQEIIDEDDEDEDDEEDEHED